MASPGGPAADVKVGTDILAAVAKPTDAVKQLRKEIAAAERELASLVKAGNTAAAATLGGRLKTMEQQQSALNTIIKNQRDMERRNKRALDGAEIFKSVVGAQAIRQLVNGELDARGLVGLAIMSERTIAKAARDLGGVKFGRAAQSLLRVLPFIGEAINSNIVGYQQAKAMDAGHEHLGRLLQAGRIDASVYHRMNDSFQKWTNVGFDPTQMATNAVSAAQSVTKLGERDMKKAIDDARYQTYGVATFNLKDQNAVSSENLISKYRAEVEAQLDAGVALDDAAKNRIFQRVMSSAIRNDRFMAMFSEKLDEAAKKIEERRGPTEKRHAQLYWDNEMKIQDQIAIRRRFIPAKMEY